MTVRITTTNADGSTSVREVEAPELEVAFRRLQEAYVGFPWCDCEDPDPDLVGYFRDKHGVSHGWECTRCGGVRQVG